VRPFPLLAVFVLAFALGVWCAPGLAGLIHRRPVGRGLTCLLGRRICVGDADQKLSFALSDDFGGLRQVYCGYAAPGGQGVHPLQVASLAAQGCGGGRYLLEFSNGRQITSIWVDQGRIRALARNPVRRPPEP